MKNRYKCVLISDFNVDNFKAYFNNDDTFPLIDSDSSSFGQVVPSLINEDNSFWEKTDLAVVWTQPEKVIKSFGRVLNYENVRLEDIYEEIDEYASLVNGLTEKVSYVFVPTWTVPAYNRGLGMSDMKNGIGISNTIMRMNLRLAEAVNGNSGICLLNSGRWMSVAGQRAFNPKLWYMGKVPFGNEVFIEAVKDIKSALASVAGHSKKLIVLDLDDTLWGGIVGDIGMDNLNLGGHDPVGEAYSDFQRKLKTLTNRGILLGIVSKNEEDIALGAIKNNPEMVLTIDDFAGWKINWEDKAKNIVDLVDELNLGLQSVIFIDDNPAERARVRETLPEVYVPEWPADKMLYASTLLNLPYLDSVSITEEDVKRTEMYVSERARNKEKLSAASLEEWLESIQIKVTISDLRKEDMQRAAQLLNKTNQMNLSTRRMSEDELEKWAAGSDSNVWVFRVSDKFGDLGLTGLASVHRSDNVVKIVDFVLSCRAFGRRVEEVMMHTLCTHAKNLGRMQMQAEYLKTEKNKHCLDFFNNSDFLKDKNNKFVWNSEKEYKVPSYINVTMADSFDK